VRTVQEGGWGAAWEWRKGEENMTGHGVSRRSRGIKVGESTKWPWIQESKYTTA